MTQKQLKTKLDALDALINHPATPPNEKAVALGMREKLVALYTEDQEVQKSYNRFSAHMRLIRRKKIGDSEDKREGEGAK
jgi:hypothetical protein